MFCSGKYGKLLFCLPVYMPFSILLGEFIITFSWFALGGRWPASLRQEQKLRAYREIERQNMNKALIDYLNFYLSPNGGSVASSVSSPAYEQLLVFDQLFLRFSRSR